MRRTATGNLPRGNRLRACRSVRRNDNCRPEKCKPARSRCEAAGHVCGVRLAPTASLVHNAASLTGSNPGETARCSIGVES